MHLLYMGKDGIKHYPLNRYVVQRDGNGNVVEIVTKELIDKKLVDGVLSEPNPNAVGDDGMKMGGIDDDVEVYTYVKLMRRWSMEMAPRSVGTNTPRLSWFSS